MISMFVSGYYVRFKIDKYRANVSDLQVLMRKDLNDSMVICTCCLFDRLNF